MKHLNLLGASAKKRNGRQQEQPPSKPSFSDHTQLSHQKGLKPSTGVQIIQETLPKINSKLTKQFTGTGSTLATPVNAVGKIPKTSSMTLVGGPAKNTSLRKIDLQPFIKGQPAKGVISPKNTAIPKDKSSTYMSQPQPQQKKLYELIEGNKVSAFIQDSAYSKAKKSLLNIQEYEDYQVQDSDEDESRLNPRKSMSPNSFSIYKQDENFPSKAIFTPTRKKLGLDKPQSDFSNRLQKFSKSLSNLNNFLEGEHLSQHEQLEPTISIQDSPPKIMIAKATDIQSLVPVQGGSVLSLATPGNSNMNSFRRESFLGSFLAKSVLKLEKEGKQGPKNPDTLKKSIIELTTIGDHNTHVPVLAETTSLDHFQQQNLISQFPSKFKPRRQSQGPEIKERHDRQTAAAKPIAFSRVKSKSELNSKQSGGAHKNQLNASTSAFEENTIKMKLQNSQTRDTLLSKKHSKTKSSMKQILKKSHQKLTQLLEKAQEEKDILDDFVVIDVACNGVTANEESKNFTDSDQQADFRSQSPDPNVYIPIFEDNTIVNQEITLSSLTKSFSKLAQIPTINSSNLMEKNITKVSNNQKRDELLTRSTLVQSSSTKPPGPQPRFNQSG